MNYKLYAAKGSGSAIVEALFVLADIECEVEYLQYGDDGMKNPRLEALNPLRQVPTLVLPSGAVMTESAAIVLHLADTVADFSMIPSPNASERPEFLRWLVFFCAAIYPTFTYGDFPHRWVTDEQAGEELVRTTDTQRGSLWSHVEGQISPAPWLLGEQLSALDIYVSVMTRWKPRRAWFKHNCPKLHAIATRMDENPKLSEIWSRNFDEKPQFNSD